MQDLFFINATTMKDNKFQGLVNIALKQITTIASSHFKPLLLYEFYPSVFQVMKKYAIVTYLY